MASGTEVRLFDPRRNPPDWVEVMLPAQCAVFLKHRTTSAPLDRAGQPYSKVEDVSCVLFDRLDEAQRFCEANVQTLPHIRCEIYNSEGLAHPPLLVIVHADFAAKEETSSRSSRFRRVAAAVLLVMCPVLFLIRAGSSDSLSWYLAGTSFFSALRLLYWDFGLKHRESERRTRLEAHRKLEQADS